MQYLVSFLEGVITFISPCLLPMLPVYISYFAGAEQSKGRALKQALGFVLGFTLVFMLMGAFAGSIGRLLTQHQTVLNIVTGAIVIIFGLSYMGLFHLPFFQGGNRRLTPKGGVFSAILFGMVFSIGWTPCVGAFLGSALMLASQQGSVLQGLIMLLSYSLGLGIPFILSAVLIDRLKNTFAFIKRHYKPITIVSGCLLVAVGILMMTGQFSAWLALLSV